MVTRQTQTKGKNEKKKWSN